MGMGVEQRRTLNFARCCLYVSEFITSCAGILAIVQRVLDARANVEKRMPHCF